MARTTTQSMSKIWKSRGLSIGLEVRILRATVFSIATYGCESWVMTKNDKKRIDAFEVWCYRRLLRISWTDKKTNIWVVNKIGTYLTLVKFCKIWLKRTSSYILDRLCEDFMFTWSVWCNKVGIGQEKMASELRERPREIYGQTVGCRLHCKKLAMSSIPGRARYSIFGLDTLRICTFFILF